MANATVEKVKKFGLRHGEKMAVGLIAALCVVFLVMAWSRETIDFTPDQIKSAADKAESNINRTQRTEDIIARLDTDNLVVPNFAKLVADSQTGGKKALAMTGPPLVFPEPGAGLIRETPELIAPGQLFATPSRGAIPVFERDDQGNLVYEEAKKEEPKKSTSRRSRRNRYSAGMSSSADTSAMMASAMMGGAGAAPARKETEAEKKKREESEARRRKQLFVGQASETEKKVAEELEEKAKEGQLPKETTRGYRIVGVVGELDHKKMLDEYAKKLKDPNAQPHYLRLDVERRQLSNEQWSEWAPVDRAANEDILAHVTQTDEELTPQDVRLEGLVDMLPFFQVGYHRGVHVLDLVPEEKRNPTPSTPPGGMMMAGRAGYSMGPGESSGMGSGMSSGDSSMESGYDPAGMSSVGSDMGSGMASSGAMDMGSSSMMGMKGGMGMGMGAAGGGPPEDQNFPKTSAPKIMVRALDFTVEPDMVYEYRVRIVVRNPNLGWESVKPGTDVTTEELTGPWSEPTAPVQVPADLTTYAMQVSPNSTDGSSIQFQVVKWNEADGLTVVRTFDEVPGQIIGDASSTPVPKEDGKGRTSRSIDFTSRQVLLDSGGGNLSLSSYGMGNASFPYPALAVVMRSDGLLVLRDQALDTHNQEMRSMKEIYDQILSDADSGGKQPPGMGGMGSMSGVSSDMSTDSTR